MVQGVSSNITALGWRQGSVVPQNLLEKESRSHHHLKSGSLFIVISQDCDVVCPSFEAEPYVEVLVASAISQSNRDGNLLHGKNPRRFQFATIQVGEESQLYEVNVNNRLVFNRQILENGPPSSMVLEPAIVTALATWIGKRYTRSAFPDQFNRRTYPAAIKIAKLLKNKGEFVTGIRLRLSSEDELAANQEYQILLFVIALPESCENEQLERELLKTVNEIEKTLDACQGVHVVEAHLRSESEFSLTDVRNTKRWDFDYLSNREGTPERITPDS